ncbi:MAG TPA: hypothetical protein VHT94_06320, partial [Streptosporangiaceae bacterium]|nr:hypothetical protein [Streptosporangiaceae bacterium]
GASKAGGVLVIAMVTAAISSPSLRATALAGAIPLALALAAVVLYTTETRKRKLEEISAGLVAADLRELPALQQEGSAAP